MNEHFGEKGNNSDRKDGEGEHSHHHALVYVLKQDVEGHSCESEEDRIQQVGDDGQADQPGLDKPFPVVTAELPAAYSLGPP